jgi:hypothetical protein
MIGKGIPSNHNSAPFPNPMTTLLLSFTHLRLSQSQLTCTKKVPSAARDPWRRIKTRTGIRFARRAQDRTRLEDRVGGGRALRRRRSRRAPTESAVIRGTSTMRQSPAVRRQLEYVAACGCWSDPACNALLEFETNAIIFWTCRPNYNDCSATRRKLQWDPMLKPPKRATNCFQPGGRPARSN